MYQIRCFHIRNNSWDIVYDQKYFSPGVGSVLYIDCVFFGKRSESTILFLLLRFPHPQSHFPLLDDDIKAWDWPYIRWGNVRTTDISRLNRFQWTDHHGRSETICLCQQRWVWGFTEHWNKERRRLSARYELWKITGIERYCQTSSLLHQISDYFLCLIFKFNSRREQSKKKKDNFLEKKK